MPVAIETTTDLLREAAGHTVYLREDWDDDQEEQAHLYANTITWTAGPRIATAQLSWQYGVGLRQGEDAFDLVQRLRRLRHYVKIAIDQPDDADGNPVDPSKWYGVLEQDQTHPDGPFCDPEAADRQPSGKTAFTAYGLEVLLDRQKLCRAWVGDGTYIPAGGDIMMQEKEVGRGLTFNADDRGRPQPNRSHGRGPRGTYIFCESIGAGDETDWWSTRDILEYLVKYHMPTDHLGNQAITWKIDDLARIFYLPDRDQPKLRMHGRTVKQLLDRLLDRRRLLSYTIEVIEGEGEMETDLVVIRPFNFLDQALVWPDSGYLQRENCHQFTLDFDRALDLQTACHVTAAGQTYDQVRAVGAPILCCGTISGLDGTLVAGWDAAMQTAYNQGASLEADYPAADHRWERQERNAVVRAQESLRRVYSWFALPAEWDGKISTGGGGTAYLFPFDELERDPDNEQPWWQPAMRFERHLPLLTDHEYGGVHIAEETVVDNTPADQTAEFRPPYAVIKLADSPSGGTRYSEIEKIAMPSQVELYGDGTGRTFSASVRMQTDAPGIIVRVSGDYGQHAIAAWDFPPLECDEDPGPFDWRNDLAVTIAMRADWHVEEQYPEHLAAHPTDAARIMTIDAGRIAELHYVAPWTIVDLLDGSLVRTLNGGFVRDDRGLLKDLARVAYEWYGQERQTLDLTYRSAAEVLRIGDLITKIGADATEETIRTVVTQITVTLARTTDEIHTTQIKTQWAELDPLRLLD